MKKKNSKLKVKSMKIADVKHIFHQPYNDERGYLERIFCSDELKGYLKKDKIVQVNRTLTRKKGTIRGLHYQKRPFDEIKIIQCLKGELIDVAVDLRKNSKTFLKHVTLILSSRKKESILIPQGFAHGFQSLTDNVELLYLHTKAYNARYEDGINPFDKVISINWPLKCKFISHRDKNLNMISENILKKGLNNGV